MVVMGQIFELCDDDFDYFVLVLVNFVFGGVSDFCFVVWLWECEGWFYGVDFEFDVGVIDCVGSFVVLVQCVLQNFEWVYVVMVEEIE